MDRRQILSFLTGAVLSFPLVALAKKKKKKKKGKGGASAVEMVKPGEGVAGSVKYVEDGAKAEAALKKVTQGCAFSEQNCANCILATKTDEKNGDKKIFKCSLFPGKFVAEKGWCVSWSKHMTYTCKKA